METYASATLPKYLLNKFSLIDLDRCFEYFAVDLKAVKMGEESITLKLYGDKDNIKKAIKGLYSLINSDYKKQAQIDTEPLKRVPNKIKNSLNENEETYRANYEKLADQYIQDCFTNNIQPHPEVVDGFVF
ncbi:MAG: hypothetical protein O3C63_06835 [Cyanobacteria bacterium]|nr:hypothetical protein [Cyanobacteriota bacterium]MDA1021653.1 hypothetical protein [Cyanobacteriota bacterium]